MALTKAQIRDRAAEELGIKMLNQSLQNQDQVRIEQAYDEVYADLKADGIATWASTASVPNELAPWVVALTAKNCLGVYGVSLARYQRIMAMAGMNGEIAKRELRKLTAPFYVSQDGPTDY